MTNPNKLNTSDRKRPFSFKNLLPTLALALTLFGATSCDKGDDNNDVTPKSTPIVWIEGEETPTEGVIKIRDILQNNADVRAYLGTRDADYYANQLEEQLKIVGGDPEHLGDILVKLYNDLYVSSNTIRLGAADQRPEDARALQEMIAKLLNYIPNNGEIIFGGDRSNAGATTTFDEASKNVA